ncbi:NUDIX hydrolase [Mesorhizobium sp. RP14(2022)]|uniref:NUDIX hydrolase n=1 Tax=Mesorhizobium liriopis TaxID=2953882 RepID=A0ABT1CB43_9HYPH|nr:NUDIX hydrolase [Mesorhizobium liriopis]MCO6051913.1 NUDIX hydrolase [Mesorhizobium liriopis]
MKEKRVRKLAKKTQGVQQIAALPVRETPEGGVEILLLTSRETRRFVVPKGWPMKGRSRARAAAIEAEQEAGVLGTTAKKPIGAYHYWKRLDTVFVPVTVDVFELQVTEEKGTWLEKHQRERQWLPGLDAARLVDEPELADLIERYVTSRKPVAD